MKIRFQLCVHEEESKRKGREKREEREIKYEWKDITPFLKFFTLRSLSAPSPNPITLEGEIGEQQKQSLHREINEEKYLV